MKKKGGELVMLGAYYNRIEAEMVRGLLESSGIPCKTFDDFVRSGIGLDALGGTRLMVHAEDLDKARQILALSQKETENEE